MATPLEVDMDSREKQIIFMLVGEPGIGKSSLANDIIGTEIVSVSKPGEVLDSGHTKKVTKYTKIHQGSGVTTIVYDTPGLGSEDPKIDDNRIIDVISGRLREVNVVLFCVKLDQDRLLPNNLTFKIIEALKRSPDTYKALLKKSVIILTRANLAFAAISVLEKDPRKQMTIFEQRIESFKEIFIRKLSVPGTDLDLANLAFLPAGISKSGKYISPQKKYLWLSTIWEKCFELIGYRDREAAVALFLINVTRIRVGRDPSWQTVDRKPTIQLSKEFMTRNGITLVGASGGLISALFSYLNPFAAVLSAVGTIIFAGVAYKYSTAPPCEDFKIEEEEIADGSGEEGPDESCFEHN